MIYFPIAAFPITSLLSVFTLKDDAVELFSFSSIFLIKPGAQHYIPSLSFFLTINPFVFLLSLSHQGL